VNCRSVISKAAAPRAGFGFLVLGLTFISGCGGEGYPESLDYPVRSDPLIRIRAQPKVEPKGFDKPGELLQVFDNKAHPLLAEKDLVLYPGVDPRDGKEGIAPGTRDKLQEELFQLFGTPAEPVVEGIPGATRGVLKLRSGTLEKGSKLYRLHCLHCHGLSGDGRGPTAPWVNPHPRDYRLGVFKFTSSSQDEGKRKPRRADLARTIREGVEGTSMPSFKLLAEDDVQALVSYVIHLSLRGETEFQVMSELIKNPSGVKNIRKELLFWVKELANERWLGAEQSKIAPAEQDYPYKTKEGRPIQPRGTGYSADDRKLLKTSVQNGQTLFKSAALGCIACHSDYGRQDRYFFDAWGTIVRPANLTLGVYRGGRRPIDLYARVFAGINGANMPAVGREMATDAERRKQDKELWDVVNFLQVLPYPKMRKEYGITID
jgi:mono/diheme cytochrome c family protein